MGGSINEAPLVVRNHVEVAHPSLRHCLFGFHGPREEHHEPRRQCIALTCVRSF